MSDTSSRQPSMTLLRPRRSPGLSILWTRYGEPMKFMMVGGSVAVVSAVLLWVFTAVMRWSDWAAYGTRVIVCIELSFLLNHMYTWPSASGSLRRKFGMFNLTRAGTEFAASPVYLGLVWLGVAYQWSNLLAIAVITLLNYAIGKRVIFRSVDD